AELAVLAHGERHGRLVVRQRRAVRQPEPERTAEPRIRVAGLRPTPPQRGSLLVVVSDAATWRLAGVDGCRHQAEDRAIALLARFERLFARAQDLAGLAADAVRA